MPLDPKTRTPSQLSVLDEGAAGSIWVVASRTWTDIGSWVRRKGVIGRTFLRWTENLNVCDSFPNEPTCSVATAHGLPLFHHIRQFSIQRGQTVATLPTCVTTDRFVFFILVLALCVYMLWRCELFPAARGLWQNIFVGVSGVTRHPTRIRSRIKNEDGATSLLVPHCTHRHLVFFISRSPV